jgi:hypothetical protein
MRIALFTCIALVSFGLGGCKLYDELRTFDIDYSVDFTVPSSAIVNLPLNLPSPAVTTNSEQRFDDEGIESAWIESITLKDLSITITAPENEDFSFLESISIYINSDGATETLIATQTTIPEGAGNTLQLVATGADLYPYISQDNITLRTEVTTDETLLYDVDFVADMQVEVKATIPGT